MAYYEDLREHVRALEANDKLVRIKREINKDTELMPLVRWQFRGLPEEERKAFLFENVVDVKGKRYDIPVLVASHAASRQVYAIGMMCKPDEIIEKLAQAQLNPIEPILIILMAIGIKSLYAILYNAISSLQGRTKDRWQPQWS